MPRLSHKAVLGEVADRAAQESIGRAFIGFRRTSLVDGFVKVGKPRRLFSIGPRRGTTSPAHAGCKFFSSRLLRWQGRAALFLVN
jgi:hypothetical protein